MATTSNIYTLLKFFATHQNNAIIDYKTFFDYLRKYSQHHLEENQDLVAYIGENDSALSAELDKLVDSHKVVILTPVANRKFIVVISFYHDKYSERYKDIQANITTPFPNITDLPKNTPSEILLQRPATELLHELLKNEGMEKTEKVLYALNFNKTIPALIYPSSVSVTDLFTLAVAKVQEMLHKEEFHDYFKKKLAVSNPGKEMSAKTFFDNFMKTPGNAFEQLKESGENFYFWSQLCYFIKQDYDKVKEFTIEDINILQSVCIIEGITSFLKTRVMAKKQKDTAFASLLAQLKKTPYYYKYTELLAFKDQNGIPLIGQYTEDELKEYLQKATTKSESNDLPPLLIIRVSDDERYFILKEKVMPLVVHLCADARVTVKKNLHTMWTKYITDWDSLPEMTNSLAFEKCLQREVQATQPILYALLNSSFLPLISYYDNESEIEEENLGRLTLYRDGILISYSEILMIARQEILTDVKIKLPFWYTTPVISWIASLLFGKKKPKAKKNKAPVKSAAEQAMENHKIEEDTKEREYEAKTNGNDEKMSRKREFHKAAISVEQALVPANSTLDRELAAYCHDWNNLINKEASRNLTEDVNSLIRDYMRKVLRTLHTSGFTVDRVKNLAQVLVDSPAVDKIKNHEALLMYTELYIIKLVKNIP